MNDSNLNAVATHCQRMLDRIKALQKSNESGFWASRESGAIRRQSMELTRALADLRQGREVKA